MSESVAAPIVANNKVARTRAAERMRRYRQRRRAGLRSVTVDVREAEIDQLIRYRLLASANRDDPIALRKALHGLLDQVFR
jgi:hypothetical protein